ncbi:DEAD/DEAH box helicase [Crenobacter oryzisoli]|uniref:DEAD/DEAH box helicase n=1 Tax=Crenobacter oryzisoli TaxID=3056844 RepID=UPI0025AEC475|nr:DEAD/DEAH box helicase [Crenobacter sp. SG2305]
MSFLQALKQLPSHYVERGVRYSREGRVNIVVLDETGCRAEVQGSEHRPYRVTLYFEPDGKIDDDCSCPIGGGCKHVAAVLTILAEQAMGTTLGGNAIQPVAARDELSFALRWLAETPGAPAAEGKPEEHVRYLLSTTEWADPVRLTLSAKLFHRLKNGKWSAPRRYDYFAPDRWRKAPAYLQPIDHQIGQLAWRASYYRDDPIELADETGALLLQLLAESGRCYLEKFDGLLLRWGEPLPLTMAWHSHEDGATWPQPIAGELDTATSCVLPYQPPCYLDYQGPNTAIAGRANSPWPAPLLAHLLHASAMPTPMWQQLAEREPQQWNRLSLPLPGERPLRVVSDVAPSPVLRVRFVGSADAPQRVIQPGFDYDGVHVGAGDEACVTVRQDGQAVQVWRDLAAEAGWLSALAAPPARDCYPPALWPALQPGDRAQPNDMAWVRFLSEAVPALRAAGWHVEIAPEAAVEVLSADDWWGELEESGNDWFSLELGVVVDGEKLSLLPLLVDAIRQAPADYRLEALAGQAQLLLPAGPGRYLTLPGERLRPILATLTELFERDAPLDGPLQLPASHAARLGELGELPWAGGERLRALVAKLKDFQGIQPLAAPQGFRATLRGYQQQGLGWLQFLREYGLNGVLADDMGLGKTVQALAHIVSEKVAGRLDAPCLVIAPTSLMFNWQREASQFAPDLTVLLLHGPQRHRHFEQLGAADVVLTTYPLLARDQETLRAQRWHVLILDEAQAIKNPKAQAAQIVRELDARHRLCLTGTPMENHLGELWALFDFLMPGFLGSETQFKRVFRTPIEKQGDNERRRSLARRVAPFLLRRSKNEVATELPPKTEIVRAAELSGTQRDLYETVRLALHEKVRREVAAKGFKRSQIVILDALLKLREACCDPRLVKLEQAATVKHSAKLELLMQLLPELVEEGRRILLFSSFTRMLGLIEDELKEHGIEYVKLTGQTRDRATPVARFQAGEVPVFLISLKAGGVGLNLTAADTVIHYDPWWNPAVEEQATDRAYRIGQDKPVFVYRLLCQGTVEEKMQTLKDRKQALAAGVYGETGDTAALLAPDDLSELFAPLDS